MVKPVSSFTILSPAALAFGQAVETGHFLPRHRLLAMTLAILANASLCICKKIALALLANG